MDRSFSRITFLEYRLKAAEAEVSAFKSGKKYQKIHEVHRKEVKALEQEIRHRKEETAQARRDTGLKSLRIFKRSTGRKKPPSKSSSRRWKSGH